MQDIYWAVSSTLSNIWGVIDWEGMNTQRLFNIWNEFSNKVKSAAYTTNSYENFVCKLCQKFGISTLRFREISQINKKFSTHDKNEILKELRHNTQMHILELRLNREIFKEQRELLEKKKYQREKETLKANENRKIKLNKKGEPYVSQ